MKKLFMLFMLFVVALFMVASGCSSTSKDVPADSTEWGDPITWEDVLTEDILTEDILTEDIITG